MIQYNSLNMRLDDGFELRRSYSVGLDRGFLTKDPSQLHDPNVCVPYRNTSGNSTASKRDNAVPLNHLRRARQAG